MVLKIRQWITYKRKPFRTEMQFLENSIKNRNIFLKNEVIKGKIWKLRTHRMENDILKSYGREIRMEKKYGLSECWRDCRK
jgi:hypothetical protein